MTEPGEIEDAAADVSELDAELDAIEPDLEEDLDVEISNLIQAVREQPDVSLEIAVHFSGDESTALFVREDIREQFSEPELADRVEALAMKGLGDPPREESLYDFGRLDATIRWYDEVLVAVFPYGEWSGIVFTFDRDESPLVDLAAEYLHD